MARVNPEGIVEHLSSEFRKALSATIRDKFPELHFDEQELFREFRRNVGRNCSTMEMVPDQFVEK